MEEQPWGEWICVSDLKKRTTAVVPSAPCHFDDCCDSLVCEIACWLVGQKKGCELRHPTGVIDVISLAKTCKRFRRIIMNSDYSPFIWRKVSIHHLIPPEGSLCPSVIEHCDKLRADNMTNTFRAIDLHGKRLRRVSFFAYTDHESRLYDPDSGDKTKAQEFLALVSRATGSPSVHVLCVLSGVLGLPLLQKLSVWFNSNDANPNHGYRPFVPDHVKSIRFDGEVASSVIEAILDPPPGSATGLESLTLDVPMLPRIQDFHGPFGITEFQGTYPAVRKLALSFHHTYYYANDDFSMLIDSIPKAFPALRELRLCTKRSWDVDRVHEVVSKLPAGFASLAIRGCEGCTVMSKNGNAVLDALLANEGVRSTIEEIDLSAMPISKHRLADMDRFPKLRVASFIVRQCDPRVYACRRVEGGSWDLCRDGKVISSNWTWD